MKVNKKKYIVMCLLNPYKFRNNIKVKNIYEYFRKYDNKNYI